MPLVLLVLLHHAQKTVYFIVDGADIGDLLVEPSIFGIGSLSSILRGLVVTIIICFSWLIAAQ